MPKIHRQEHAKLGRSSRAAAFETPSSRKHAAISMITWNRCLHGPQHLPALLLTSRHTWSHGRSTALPSWPT